jgi:hypothetical protein
MEQATGASWKHLPEPSHKEDLRFTALFTEEEAEQLVLGFVPEHMEDKWFIYFENGWLRFHRSWTGAFIYALRLDGSSSGVRVLESWVNRDTSQYRLNDSEFDRRLVRYLIDVLLLKKRNVVFPVPPQEAGAPRPS